MTTRKGQGPPLQTRGAAQSGSWSVDVGNTPSVNVASLPNVSLAAGSSIRDADNPARQAFQKQFSFSDAGSGLNTVCQSITTAGEEVVIEYVSAQVDLVSGQKVLDIRVFTNSGGVGPVPHHFAPTFQGTVGGSDVFVAGSPTRLYHDPGSCEGCALAVCIERDASAFEVNGGVSLSGYKVTLP